jgi:hypothetical protein
MNEVPVSQPEQVAAPPRSKPADPLQRWTLVILVICVILLAGR